MIAGNQGVGIDIDSDGTSTGDLIEGNKIGVLANSTDDGNDGPGISANNTSGLMVLGNTIENNGDVGIAVGYSSGTTIGGTAPARPT